MSPFGFSDNEYGTVPEIATVRFERVLPGPIERVWEYLTDSEKRGTWLATGLMEQRPGGSVELHYRHADLTTPDDKAPEKFRDLEKGFSFSGRVTRCEPPRLLSFTWGGAPDPNSEVTIELKPRGKDVLLTLVHRHLGDRRSVVMHSTGWHTHLTVLADRLSNAAVRPFWATFVQLEDEYEKRIK
jgi:uncharacterized protein YndB with AHSA1/START domain